MINKILKIIGRLILGLVIIFFAILIQSLFALLGGLVCMGISNSRILNSWILIIIGFIVIYCIGYLFEKLIKR
jgi:ABC-type transport system involved in multi-copper enzyme maturation permease subunit